MDRDPGGRPAVRGLLAPPQRWEAVLAGTLGAILATSFALPPESLPGIPLCQFKAVTGLPCPGCGLTRSFCAISHGRLANAWAYNPFGLPLYALTAFFLLFPLLNRGWPGLGSGLQRWKVAKWFPIALVAVMWIWGLWRILAGPGPDPT